jgi:NAD+ kinase
MRLGIIGHLEKPGLAAAVCQFVGQLNAKKVDFLLEERAARLVLEKGYRIESDNIAVEQECYRSGDMLVAFGGDGTILAAARAVGTAGTPILGINLGKLGFLAEVAPSEIAEAVEDIVRGRYSVEQRLVLQGTSPQLPRRTLHAVNDIVVDKGRSSRMIELHTKIDGAFAVTYRGDGLILSTPTGSTAYALSNGGPIVIPTSSVFGLTPISPHSLSGRPLVVPDTSVVSIVVESADEEVLVSADGQEEALVKAPIEIVIRKADYSLHLVRRSNRSYFDVLRAKLLWGRDPRSS